MLERLTLAFDLAAAVFVLISRCVVRVLRWVFVCRTSA